MRLGSRKVAYAGERTGHAAFVTAVCGGGYGFGIVDDGCKS